jgi:hypothetical protein
MGHRQQDMKDLDISDQGWAIGYTVLGLELAARLVELNTAGGSSTGFTTK